MSEQLGRFEPGGPQADTYAFIVLEPAKAVLMRMHGINGRQTWSAA